MKEEFLTKHIEKKGALTFKYNIEWTGLFGERFFVDIIKECKNIPGFAPTHYDSDCGQLVMNFKSHEPYWSTPVRELPNLELEEIKTIYDFLKKGFEEVKHPTVEELRTHLKKLEEESNEKKRLHNNKQES